jgi:N-acetylmuramoyl-L-alanine amidase
MAKVFIGVGHGGTDSGAVANGFKEKDLNLAIALACRDVLKRHNVNVLLSREKDENDTLNDEIKKCNAFNPNLAIDIHNNAGGGDGAEAFYHYGGGTGKTLANNVLNEIVKIGQNSRGAKIKRNILGKDYYGFIREIKAPAVIVECAFLDNKTDIKIIDTAAEQKKMGEAIAKGILKTLGIAYIEQTVEKPVENVKKLYKVQVGAYATKGNAVKMQNKLKAAGFEAVIV